MELAAGVSLGSSEICRPAVEVGNIDDLLTKILVGLPLRSLRLSKLVCKRWYTLISDPSLNAVRSRNANADYGFFVQLNTGFCEFVYVPSIERRCPLVITSFPFYRSTENQFSAIKVFQSCNGVLLCKEIPDKLYVYNPTINHCKLLPLPNIWKPKRFLQCMAIGFDPKVSPHYKVVYFREESFGNTSAPVRVEIYFSETGKWRFYPHIFRLISFLTFSHYKRVVYWHDAIHWMDRFNIYHFSLDTENPHFIQVENQLEALDGATYGPGDNLFVSSCDRLLLVKIESESYLQMKIYEMGSDYSFGWFVKYHVNLPNNFSCWSKFKVVSIGLGEDPFLVLIVTGIVLLRYNIVSKTFCELCDLTQIRQLDTPYSSFLFMPCLVGESKKY